MNTESEHSPAVINVSKVAEQLQIVARTHIPSVVLVEVGETVVEEHIALQLASLFQKQSITRNNRVCLVDLEVLFANARRLKSAYTLNLLGT